MKSILMAKVHYKTNPEHDTDLCLLHEWGLSRAGPPFLEISSERLDLGEKNFSPKSSFLIST